MAGRCCRHRPACWAESATRATASPGERNLRRELDGRGRWLATAARTRSCTRPTTSTTRCSCSHRACTPTTRRTFAGSRRRCWPPGRACRPRQPVPGAGVRTQIQNALVALPEHHRTTALAAWPGVPLRLSRQGRPRDAVLRLGVYLNNVPGNPLGETRQITQNITHQGTFGFKADVGGDGSSMATSRRAIPARTTSTTTARVSTACSWRWTQWIPTHAGRRFRPSGNPVCRVASPTFDPTYYKSFADCVPINLFGGWNNISPQAAAYVSGPQKMAEQYYDLKNGELSANGKLLRGLGRSDQRRLRRGLAQGVDPADDAESVERVSGVPQRPAHRQHDPHAADLLPRRHPAGLLHQPMATPAPGRPVRRP